jgi:hypothetical protein
MADLVVTNIAKRVPLGKHFLTVARVTIASTAAADERIEAEDTYLSEILAVGHAVLGTTNRGVNMVMNATGTGETEGGSPGEVGIEASGACHVIVWMLGRP